MYKKMKAEEGVPKKYRPSVFRFESTPEWKLMRADIERGLKPGEVLQVLLTAEEKEQYNIKERRTVARFLKKFLDERNLPYTLKSFHRPDEGDFFIVSFPKKAKAE